MPYWPNSISSIEGAETRERTTGATGALNERAAAELSESIVLRLRGVDSGVSGREGAVSVI